jgi:ribA/ribD-fused uncharacterized protein
MKYNITNIARNSEYIFFWGHQASKDGIITKSCFSQWWLSSFVVEDVLYYSAEHWMMAKKAELFDTVKVHEIINTKSPSEVKTIGKEIENYDENIWKENRYEIVKQGTFHKFSQNQVLKTFLLSTKEKIIVEASPVDKIWGIGLAPDDKKINNPNNWRGLNLLGFALMEIRDELKK